MLLIANGSSTKEIAGALGLSWRTVAKHRENLMLKLNLHDTAGVVRHGLAEQLKQRETKQKGKRKYA